MCSFIRWKGMWMSCDHHCALSASRKFNVKNLLKLARTKILILCRTLWQRFIPCCSEGVCFGKLVCLCLIAVLLRKIYQNQQSVLYSNSALGIKMCQEDCNAILIVAPKCVLVGPLCSVSCTDLVLLVLEMEFFKLWQNIIFAL